MTVTVLWRWRFSTPLASDSSSSMLTGALLHTVGLPFPPFGRLLLVVSDRLLCAGLFWTFLAERLLMQQSLVFFVCHRVRTLLNLVVLF